METSMSLYARSSNEQLLMETVVSSLDAQIQARFGGVRNLLRLKGPELETARGAVAAAAKRGLTTLAGEINKCAKARVIQRGGGKREVIWVHRRMANFAKEHDEQLQRQWKAHWDKVVDITLAPAEAE
jgi:hypothetical protein